MDRNSSLKAINKQHFDVLIVGAGNSGASIASCLSAGKNKVAIIDKNDFASGTSQNSSNLIWGGIKYLENFEFSLVRKLCLSRNELIKNFPNMVEEIRFYCPHEKTAKHSFLKLFLGTFFYWLWGNCFTKKPKKFAVTTLGDNNSIPIKPDNIDGIFEYSDAYLPENDARFVFNFIKETYNNGGVVGNYLELKEAHFHANSTQRYWEIQLYDHINKKKLSVTTKVLINAAGGYVDHLNQMNHITTQHIHCFSKGVHIIVDKLFDQKKVLTFFSDDNRLFFAIPMGNATAIGTTDTIVDHPETEISQDDIKFILDNINRLLRLPKPLSTKDIISTRVGVRPLAIPKPTKTEKSPTHQQWFNISRKHIIEVNEKNYLSIFGGKLTDCINIAEEATLITKNILSKNKRKNGKSKIQFNEWIKDHQDSRKKFYQMFSALVISKNTTKNNDKKKDQQLIDLINHWEKRLWRRYGIASFKVVAEIEKVKPFLKELIPDCGFTEGEINYQIKNEMVVFREDLIRRRNMLGLVIKEDILDQHPLIKKLKSNKR